MKQKKPFKLTAFNHGSAESTKCAEKKERIFLNFIKEIKKVAI